MVLEIICFGMLPWFSYHRNQPYKSLSPYFDHLFNWIQESYPYPVSMSFYKKICCAGCHHKRKTVRLSENLNESLELSWYSDGKYLRFDDGTDNKMNEDSVGKAELMEIDWKFRIFIANFIHFSIFLKNIECTNNNPDNSDMIPDEAKYVLKFFKTRLGLSDDNHFQSISKFYKHSPYSFDLRKLHKILLDPMYCTSFRTIMMNELKMMIPMPYHRFLGDGIFNIGCIQSHQSIGWRCWEFVGFKIVLPLFVVSKGINFIFPLLYLLLYFMESSGHEIDVSRRNFHWFQLTSTFVYIALILFGILGMIPFAYRYYIAVWHLSAINVNRQVIDKYFSNAEQIESIVNNTKYFYCELYTMMISTQYIHHMFGSNIGDIVCEYISSPKLVYQQIMFKQKWPKKVLEFRAMDSYQEFASHIL